MVKQFFLIMQIFLLIGCSSNEPTRHTDCGGYNFYYNEDMQICQMTYGMTSCNKNISSPKESLIKCESSNKIVIPTENIVDICNERIENLPEDVKRMLNEQ